MKKKILILMPILLILCLSPIAEARTIVQSGGVDESALFTYYEWFADFSAALIITTTAVNNSGINEAWLNVVVICVNKSRNFRLRIFDDDDGKFIDVNDEDSIGSKSRKFFVDIHMDSDDLTWTAFATDMTGELTYAQISLFYLYDEEAGDFGDDRDKENNTISQEELEKMLKIATRNTSLSYLAATFLTIVLTSAIVIQRKGSGVKAFIKSKIKGTGD